MARPDQREGRGPSIHGKHVGMTPQRRRDSLQIDLGLLKIAQFNPADRGGKKMCVGWTERLHQGEWYRACQTMTGPE